jgi:hypothetical protein
MSPLFSPVSAGGIGKATFTSQTGGTTDTSTRAGKTIVKYTGTGSITVGTSGYCEVLVIGGGGTGQYGGGGAGGLNYNTSAYIPAGTYTVTVGAGAPPRDTSSGSAAPSAIGVYWVAPPGGTGTSGFTNGAGYMNGGSGGGTYSSTAGSYGLGLPGLGNNGGIGGNTGYGAAGGGGGAGAAGSNGNPTTGYGGTGGNGLSVPITGTAVVYAGGGGGWGGQAGGGGPTGGGGPGGDSNGPNAGIAGAANKGAGGGGGYGVNGTTGAGGSGYVVIVFG